jgi:pimeloyl-ACP methyl ester carboxylesterase
MAYFDTERGLQLHYRTAGHGPVAAFIHPPLLDSTLWLDQLQGLADIRRCLAVDLVGHGDSDPNPAAVFRPSDHGRDVSAWLTAAAPNGPIDLVGLGAGALIAALVYESDPSRIRSLTLISPRFDLVEAPTEQRYHQEFARLVVVEEREVVLHRLMEDTLPRDASLPVKARYRSMLQRTPVESVVRVLEGRSNESRPDLAAKLALPVLAVSGGAEAKQDADLAAAPSVRTVRLAQAGALAPIEDPVALNGALRRFWLRVSPPPPVGLGARP